MAWGGKRAGSGRKKAIGTLINEAITNLDQNLPELFEALTKQALEGDREALIYLIDRRLGKPKVVSDINIEGEIIGKGLMVALLKELDRGGSDFLLGKGEEDATYRTS